jgi:hypothetical protein
VCIALPSAAPNRFLGCQLVDSTAPGKASIGLLEEQRLIYEREARAFAAELLMPFFEVRKRWFAGGGAIGAARAEDGELRARLAQAVAHRGGGLGLSRGVASREGPQVATLAAPLLLWTPAEIRRFLLAAPEEWRPVRIVALFSGLRPGEI